MRRSDESKYDFTKATLLNPSKSYKQVKQGVKNRGIANLQLNVPHDLNSERMEQVNLHYFEYQPYNHSVSAVCTRGSR